MSSLLRRPALLMVLVGACLLPMGSCGYSDGGGGRIVGQPIVGGVFLPGKLTYGTLDMADERGQDTDLPSQVDLRRDGVVPPIQNQRWNNCVGWSLGYYLMSGLELRHYREHHFYAGNILDPGDKDNWFSPDYLYSQRELDEAAIVERAPHLAGQTFCREVDGLLGCMRPEWAISRLLTEGCARWSFLCSDEHDALFRACGVDAVGGSASTSRAPWSFASLNGYWFRPRCFVRFGVLQEPGSGFRPSPARQMQRWLHEQGTPIAIVVEMKSGWVSYRGEHRIEAPVELRGRNDGLTEERGVCLDAGGASLGAQHMMTIIGYDRGFLQSSDNPDGAFLVANQWGRKWGHEGYMWIPVSELERIWLGGYGLVKWIPGAGNAAIGGRTVCAPNEYGEYVDLSEDDDVPRNVKRIPGGCTPLCGYQYDSSTTPTLDLSAGSAEVSGRRVGQWQNESIDVADWYRLAGVSAGQVLTCLVRTSVTDAGENAPEPVTGPLGPVVRLKVTDGDLKPLGVHCPRTGVTTVQLVGDEFFLKVEPSYGGAYEARRVDSGESFSGVEYTLTVTVIGAAEDPEACEAAQQVGAVEPLIRSSLEVDLPEDGAWRCFRLDEGALAAATWSVPDLAWALPGSGRPNRLLGEKRIAPRITLEGLTGTQRAEVVVAGPVNWWSAAFPLTGFRDFEVCTVEGERLQLDLRPQPGAPHADSRNEWEPFVAVRNRSGAPIRVTLGIQILPPKGVLNDLQPFDPGIEAVAKEELPGWWVPADAQHANRFRLFDPAFIFNGHWGSELLELFHASPGVQIRLVDGEGAPFGDTASLVDFTRIPATSPLPPDPALRPAGAERKRLEVTETPGQPIWVELYAGDGVTPIPNLRLRRSNANSLAYWPMSSERSFVTAQGNDAPAGATPLVAGTTLEESIGFYRSTSWVFGWDFFDYIVIHNDAETARVPRVRFVKPIADKMQNEPPTKEGEQVPWEDTNLHVFCWRLAEPDKQPKRTDIVKGNQDWTFDILGPGQTVEPGARVLMLVYSGTQARSPYTLDLTWH